MVFENKLEEAKHVVDWHMFSDKTSDPKNSDMSLEEAESIIAKNSENG